MNNFHIVQAGIANGDLEWLKKSAKLKLKSQSWIVPKSATKGDGVAIFVRGLGFVATARIMSNAVKRTDWINRYGASIGEVQLIEPPLSIAYIKKNAPRLTWANYPRSITTPTQDIASELINIIKKRRISGVTELNEAELNEANLYELRIIAKEGTNKNKKTATREYHYKLRSAAIRRYALTRSDGCCEFCNDNAPFKTTNNEPYLEVHHIWQLSDDGPDDPENVIALCPNCHRRAHFGKDENELKAKMQKIVLKLEADV